MKTIDQYDDYLRTACGLDYFDGPPLSLTLDQARAALLALAADADKELARARAYHGLLARAIRHAKQPQNHIEKCLTY